MSTRNLYLYEVVDVVGQGQYAYMEHLWQDPVLRMPEMFGLQGSFYVCAAAGGRWPQVINIWDVGARGWLGWASNVDRMNLKRRKAFYGDWWDQAAEWRSGGFDRLCGGVPGSPTTEEIAARGVHGTLFVNEILSVRPGAQLDFLAAVVAERVPFMREYGHEPTGLYEVLSNQHEVVMVWATDIPAQVRLRQNRDTTRGLCDEGEVDDRLVVWERRSAEYVTGGDTHVMTPLPRTVYGPPDWEDASLDDWLAKTESANMSDMAFEQIANFRDAGGHLTDDGRLVRTGLLYRCGHLAQATDADIDTLEQLGVGVVVDLRRDAERVIEGESRLPRGAEVVCLPMGDVRAGPDIRAVLGSGDVAKIRETFPPGAAREMMLRGSQSFVVDEMHCTQYASFVRTLLAANGTPVVVHCSAGKDRTGWAIALVLLALGVPEQLVVDDYLRSNDAQALRMANVARSTASGLDPGLLEPLVMVHVDYITTSLTAVEEHWGGLEDYLGGGLGMDAQIRSQLRSVFLEPEPTAWIPGA